MPTGNCICDSDMNYCEIKRTDIANGPGVRVSLFVSGCRNHCRGCFQPETWDFEYGSHFTTEIEDILIEALQPPWIQGLSLLGGDPMEPENQEGLLPFLRRVKTELPGKDIWLYTGYPYELVRDTPLMQYIDVVVDGPFIEAEKDISLAFRGSRNQRIIDAQTGRDLPEYMAERAERFMRRPSGAGGKT